ncbi:MAG TPA: hypothetical protein VK550_16500 [Polyangiaceae bacterium]|nr:hypothetical protein [Polyangiaceae bacterium]
MSAIWKVPDSSREGSPRRPTCKPSAELMNLLFWKLAAVFIIANAAMRYRPGSHF